MDNERGQAVLWTDEGDCGKQSIASLRWGTYGSLRECARGKFRSSGLAHVPRDLLCFANYHHKSWVGSVSRTLPCLQSPVVLLARSSRHVSPQVPRCENTHMFG